MDSLVAIAWAAGWLLIVTGMAKARNPATAATALLSIGWRWYPTQSARVVGALELVVGVGVVGWGTPIFAALAALFYIIFSIIVLFWLRTGKSVSCGCAGSADTPATYAHLVVTAGSALAMGAALAAGGLPAVGQVEVDSGLLLGMALVGYSLIIAFLSWMVIAVLPTVKVTGEAELTGKVESTRKAESTGKAEL